MSKLRITRFNKIMIGVMTLTFCITASSSDGCVQILDDGTYTVDNLGCVE